MVPYAKKRLTFYHEWIVAVVAVLFVVAPTATHAASMYISQSAAPYAVGTTVSATVYVSSDDQAMNAASGVLAFPADKLEVLSLSKTGSIFTLWVQEPAYSNSDGTISFEGIVLNPGFTGASGKILTINFRIKKAGLSDVGFLSGSVLANDGKGANILTSMRGTHVEVDTPSAPVQPVAQTTTTVQVKPRVLGKIAITSDTHPDQDSWYAMTTATLSWSLPSGVTAVRLIADKKPDTAPSIVHVPPITTRTITGLGDGVWYFSVQLQNAGGWGSVAQYRLQVDTEKPDRVDIVPVETESSTSGVRFIVSASDKMSGIARYLIAIDNGSEIEWVNDGSGLYETPRLSAGEHTLAVTVEDRAGNRTTSSTSFVVVSQSEHVNIPEPPRILRHQADVREGDMLLVVGATKYPEARVRIFLRHDGVAIGEYAVTTDANGYFHFMTEEGVVPGVYSMTAAVMSGDVWSLESERVEFVVKKGLFHSLDVGSIDLVIGGGASLMVLILGYVIWRLRRGHTEVKKQKPVAISAHRHMVAELVAELREQLHIIDTAAEKRPLTKEEEKIARRVRKMIEMIGE